MSKKCCEYYSYLYDRTGTLRAYVIDFAAGTKRVWRDPCDGYSFVFNGGREYMPSIDPWYIFPPVLLIGYMFFRGNPMWSWRLKEIG